jgi:3-hydroxy-9,10-secoandrosta-1,3,5(10)-triene-9,17-dione monooxygenase reductase component
VLDYREPGDVAGDAAAVSADEFRRVLGHLPTGACVVAGLDTNGRPAGLAVGSFTSVSLDPPLVSFLVATTSTSWPAIRASGGVSVSVLSHHQQDLCRSFAVSGADKFADVAWTPAPRTGAPRVAGAHAWVDVEVKHEVPLGDHFLIVGQTTALHTSGSRSPLVFYRGSYHRLAPVDVDR